MTRTGLSPCKLRVESNLLSLRVETNLARRLHIGKRHAVSRCRFLLDIRMHLSPNLLTNRTTRHLRYYAFLVAAFSLVALTIGPTVTSNEERPLYELGQWHTPAATLAGALTVGLALWLYRAEQRGWLRRLAWITVAGFITEGLLGFPPLPQPPALRVTHALLAQMLFSAIAAIAIFGSPAWQQPMEPPKGTGPLWPARITPFLVLVQVSLGVAHRHGLIGVLSHVLGALMVGIFIAVAAMLVVYRPEFQALRPAGVILLMAAGVQLFLGLALLAIQSEDVDPLVMISATMIHTAMAALTLASSVVLAAIAWQPASARQFSVQ